MSEDTALYFSVRGIKAGDRFLRLGVSSFVFCPDGDYVFNGAVMVPYIEVEED